MKNEILSNENLLSLLSSCLTVNPLKDYIIILKAHERMDVECNLKMKEGSFILSESDDYYDDYDKRNEKSKDFSVYMFSFQPLKNE